MIGHKALLEMLDGKDSMALAAMAHVEQRRADELQREAAQHQRVADAARKVIRRRKRA